MQHVLRPRSSLQRLVHACRQAGNGGGLGDTAGQVGDRKPLQAVPGGMHSWGCQPASELASKAADAAAGAPLRRVDTASGSATLAASAAPRPQCPSNTQKRAAGLPPSASSEPCRGHSAQATSCGAGQGKWGVKWEAAFCAMSWQTLQPGWQQAPQAQRAQHHCTACAHRPRRSAPCAGGPCPCG